MEWVSRSTTDDLLLETVYGQLKREVLLTGLPLLGIDRKRLTSSQLSDLVSRTGGEIIGRSSNDLPEILRNLLSRCLFEELGEERDPVVLFTLLTREPWSVYAMALSGQGKIPEGPPSALDRPIAMGVERMMADHGQSFPRKDILAAFKKARTVLREEKKRIRAVSAKERQREQHFHAWVRTLWTDRDVRRELGLRPSEFEDFVARGRIPVVLRIESLRNGRIREKRLFDPETVLKIAPSTINRWRKHPGPRTRQGRPGRIEGGRSQPRTGRGPKSGPPTD